MQRKVAGNTGLHSAVVARASTFTTITLDQNNPSIETSRDSFIRLDLADGTCLLIRTERAAVLIDEVNGKTVEPLKSNNITYRFAQDIVENWPAQALRPDMECFPAASTDVLPATYCDHFKDDPAC